MNKSRYNRCWATCGLIALIGLSVGAQAAYADTQLSADNLKDMEQWGLFTPGFQAAVHDFINTKQAIADTKKEEIQLKVKLPDLQKQIVDAQAKVDALKQQLVQYDHTDENDFVVLQKVMTDPGAKPGDQLLLAETYVWSYPLSPHQTAAQQYLQQLQKTLADQTQAQKDSEAAKVAARAKLLQRVQAKDLSLPEWRQFLYDLTEADVIKYLGQPDSQGEYWSYPQNMTTDPVTHAKVGLGVYFSAGRVNSVVGVTPPTIGKLPDTQ